MDCKGDSQRDENFVNTFAVLCRLGTLIIYIAAAIFFGIIIGIGRLLQHFLRRREMNKNKVCGEFPEYCYRAFDCKEYTEDFVRRGTFRMGCQLSYRAMKNCVILLRVLD